jgi:hypothetical protein
MIAAEQVLAPGEAKVVGGMAGGVEHLQDRTTCMDELAIVEDAVRVIVRVEARFLVAGNGERSATPDRRTEAVRKGSRGRAVVAVRMGYEDGIDRSAGDGGNQRLEVGGIGWAWIENGKPVFPDQVHPSPFCRVGRRIGCEQAGEAQPERLEDAGSVDHAPSQAEVRQSGNSLPLKQSAD